MTGYVKKTGTVVVGNSNKRILVTLDKAENLTGILEIESNPEDATVEVYIDGVWVKNKIHTLKYGTYQVRVSHANCTQKTESITIDRPKVFSTISLLFKDTYMGTVEFASEVELKALLGLPSYVSTIKLSNEVNDPGLYHKVKTYDNREILIPSGRETFYGFNYDTLKNMGFINEYYTDGPTPSTITGKVITFNGKKYRCRLLNGHYSPNYDFINNFISSEMVRLIRIIPDADTGRVLILNKQQLFINGPLNREEPSDIRVYIYGGSSIHPDYEKWCYPIGAINRTENSFMGIHIRTPFVFESIEDSGSGTSKTLTINTIPSDAEVLVTGPNNFNSSTKINSVEAGAYKIKAFKGYNAIGKNVSVSTSDITENLTLPQSNVRIHGFNILTQSYTGHPFNINTDLPISNISNVYPIENLFIDTSNNYKKLVYNESLGLHEITPITGPKIVKTSKNTEKSGSIFFIYDDGTVKGRGSNRYGELGIGNTTSQTQLVSIPITNVDNIICSSDNTFFILKDGTVKGAGSNTYGQLGIGNKIDKYSITTIPISNVLDIKAADGMTFFILKDGTAKSCGRGLTGGLALGGSTDQPTIQSIDTYTPIKDIFVSNGASYFIYTDNTIQACGANFNGEIEDPSFDRIYSLRDFNMNMSNINKMIRVSNTGTLVLMKDGTVKASGVNDTGVLGCTTLSGLNRIENVPISGVKDIIYCGWGTTLFHMTDNTIKACGRSLNNIHSPGSNYNDIVDLNIGAISKIIPEQEYGYVYFIK